MNDYMKVTTIEHNENFRVQMYFVVYAGDIAVTSFASTSNANQENVTPDVAYVNSRPLGDVTQPNSDGNATQVSSNAFTFQTFI